MSADTLEAKIRLRLGEFSLEIDERLAGEGVSAVFGPSGSGKSSFLRVLAGLERGAEGHVAFGGVVWLDTASRRFVPAHQRPVGYMFQDARLFPHLDVMRNLKFAEARATNTRSQRIDFGDVIDALDLAPLLERRTQGLSGGERQRVALGRTLLTQPQLLLLDEPLAALDSSRKREVLSYVESVQSSFGVPMIYVSHAVDEVALLADHLLVLEDGRIRVRGPTAETLRQLDLSPLAGRDRAAAVLEAQVVRHDDVFHLTWLDLGGQSLSVPQLEGLEPGARARLLVRARDVSLATARPGSISIRNVLEGRVFEIEEDPETAFAEVAVELRVDSPPTACRLRARVTRASLAELGLTAGAPVFALLKSVSVESRALHSD